MSSALRCRHCLVGHGKCCRHTLVTADHHPVAEPETDDTNKNDDSSGIHLISESVVRLSEYVTNVQLIPFYDIILLGVASLEIETNIPNSAA